MNVVENPDLVFFYSEPLVYEKWDDVSKKTKYYSTGGQELSTELEFKRLIEILQSTEKSFMISKQALNFESLKEMVSRKPKIIHLSCHGDFCEIKKEFYL